MIYKNELFGYKHTKFDHPKGLLTFESCPPLNNQMSTFECVIEQFINFTKSIHGCTYIWARDSRLAIRLFWFMVVIGSIISCIVMHISLAALHNKHQIKTVVATSQMPIYQINFPAVALCPRYRVNWHRYKAAEEKFLPAHIDKNTKSLFLDTLRVLDNMTLFHLDNLALFNNRTVPTVIDQISLNDLADFMAFRCEEVFVECIYAEQTYDCCKIFIAEQTNLGVCMVFNSIASEESRKKQLTDEFYPWKNRKAGQGTGLQFTLRLNATHERYQNYKNFDFHVMVKECEVWSESIESCFVPNRKTYLSIIPTIRETLLNTRHLDPRTRKCLFTQEKSKLYDRIEGLRFNKLNCLVKCQQNNFIRLCNCTLTWFFPKIDVRECSVSDFKCIYTNRDIISYIKSPLQDSYIKDTRRGVTCDCINSCYSIEFLTSLYANVLPNSNASYPIIQGDIYIDQKVITKYETRLHSTTSDLIAQGGAVLGLLLGASILSLAEIFYGGLKIIMLLLLSSTPQRQLKIIPQAEEHFIKK